jgi:dolichol-phosphate mannosyltransferase
MFKKIQSSDKVDIVTGTRYSKSGMVCGWPFTRKLVSMCANSMAQYVLGLSTTDLTGSFRLYKTSVLREIVPLILCKSFGFQMEVIARAELMGKRIEEVPIVFYDRVAGESKLDAKEIINFAKTVFLLSV